MSNNPHWPGAGGIHKAIPLVMKAVGAIGKDRKNPQQGYAFRGIDDVYNACQSALSENGVFVVPFVTDEKREERPSKHGGVLAFVRLTVDHYFCASDGSYVVARTIGEAMDSGDKATNKAMSAAMKYALLETLCIPTEEPKDSENDTFEVVSGPSAGKGKHAVEAVRAAADRVVNEIAEKAPELTGITDGALCAALNKLTANDPKKWKAKLKEITGREIKQLTQVKQDERQKVINWANTMKPDRMVEPAKPSATSAERLAELAKENSDAAKVSY